MRAIAHTQSLRPYLATGMQSGVDSALTGKIHDIVIEFNSGPVLEHGLERGTSPLRSFRLRNRHGLVWVHKGIGTLGNAKSSIVREIRK